MYNYIEYGWLYFSRQHVLSYEFIIANLPQNILDCFKKIAKPTKFRIVNVKNMKIKPNNFHT